MALDLTNLSNVISDIRKQDLYYIGNLKRTKAVKALTHHHFVLPGCDEMGNLLSSFVFVQFIGVKLETGFSHLLLCKSCNEESESLPNEAVAVDLCAVEVVNEAGDDPVVETPAEQNV